MTNEPAATINCRIAIVIFPDGDYDCYAPREGETEKQILKSMDVSRRSFVLHEIDIELEKPCFTSATGKVFMSDDMNPTNQLPQTTPWQPIDWNRPIRFKNGQKCSLIKEWSEPGKRFILREGVEGMTSIWEVNEEGQTGSNDPKSMAHRLGLILENYEP